MGPLRGLRVLEMAGIGPGPFGAMLLADMGADVVRVERPSTGSREPPGVRRYVPNRGKRSISIDLKSDDGRETVLRLAEVADVLVEGYRPGVMERLGLGPQTCLARNRRLVYARMTGWGQHGPLANAPGHDINYLALTGALNSFRRTGERPLPPVNIVGDHGGGGMLLAFGVMCAVHEVRNSGLGQVVDVAMIDGIALQFATVLGMVAQGRWRDEPGNNFADTGSHYYDVYETADGRFVAVGAIEQAFYDALMDELAEDLPERLPQDKESWSRGHEMLAEVFRQRDRDEWARRFEGTEACVSPVLSLTEAPGHPHVRARQVFLDGSGYAEPAPAPRFSRTPASVPGPAPTPGQDTERVLAEWLAGAPASPGKAR
jgi:alpha-methylacyl-CoA racemase